MFINLLIAFFCLLLVWQFRQKIVEGMDSDTSDDTSSTDASGCSVPIDIATLKTQYTSLQKEVDDLTTQVQSLSDAQSSMVSSIPPANVSGAESDGTTNPDGTENTDVTSANANSAQFFNSM